MTARHLPILMTPENVRRTIRGEKWQTRRVVKPQPPAYLTERGQPREMGPCLWSFPAQVGQVRVAQSNDCLRCPYGTTGDLLYVKETHRIDECDCRAAGYYGSQCRYCHGRGYLVLYRADYENKPGGLRPSIHMPKWAARLWLRVESVRVERVQDISYEDALAEGVQSTYLPLCGADGFTVYSLKEMPTQHCYGTPQFAFRQLWDSLNARRGYGWDANPWAWVITYSVHEVKA